MFLILDLLSTNLLLKECASTHSVTGVFILVTGSPWQLNSTLLKSFSEMVEQVLKPCLRGSCAAALDTMAVTYHVNCVACFGPFGACKHIGLQTIEFCEIDSVKQKTVTSCLGPEQTVILRMIDSLQRKLPTHAVHIMWNIFTILKREGMCTFFTTTHKKSVWVRLKAKESGCDSTH